MTDSLTDYLSSPEFAASEAVRDAMTTEQLEQLNRIQEAQLIVIKTTDAKGNKQIMRCCSAVCMAMALDIASPVETLVDDALSILGVGQ
jgi:hypothetical protein